MKYFRRGSGYGFEDELRAGRPEPRTEFAVALADQVRGRPAGRTRMGRIGLAMAFSGLILVAVASFGGVGYASSSDGNKQGTGSKSAAEAQYAPTQENFTPATTTKQTQTKQTPTKQEPSGVEAQVQTTQPTATQPTSPSVQKSTLPFTGLALWIPLAIGFTLIIGGATLRVRSRRGRSPAH